MKARKEGALAGKAARQGAGRTLLAVTLACAASAFAADAKAGGLYFTDRGVRPLGRGGAYVAGADDVSSIWYNPAGLADAGSSVLFDASWLHFSSGFTRQTNVPDANGTVRTYSFPTVNGSTPVLPIPTLGGSFAIPKAKMTLALGLFAPYTAIASYPLTIGADGQTPSPSRYSLVSLDGSALVVTGLWAAYKPANWIRIGLGIEALVGNFDSTVVFSACPPQSLVCAAEDPTYDAFSQLKVGPIFAPSGNGGITIVPEKHIRIGVSGQLPFHIDAPATVDVRLPNAVEFDQASQSGDKAHVKFDLPGVFRAGVEGRIPIKRTELRMELAYEHEFWSVHKSIEIVPDNIALLNVRGFPSPFAVSPISIPRNFQDSNSVRFGAEFSIPLGDGYYALEERIGVNYEWSAIPADYLSPLTIDMDKLFLGLGGSLRIGKHWRLDATYGHVFASDVYVNPAIAAVPKVNPVRGNPVTSESVNGGTYSATADILGVGLNYKF
ncbi:MAG TPA: outer membrane protein transport protein [Polyangiaceae bacterium]|jgi:long-chain fatty acid transport protein